MARGRRGQPEAVKLAKGNPGRRPIATVSADDQAAARTAAPKDLNAAGKRVWDSLAPELARLKFLRESDRTAFARYCEHLSKWWELTRYLRRNGYTYTTASNHVEMERVRPQFLVRERIEKRMEVLEDRFGLSPAARQQILQRLAAAPPPVQHDLPMADLNESLVPGEPSSPIGLLSRSTSSVH